MRKLISFILCVVMCLSLSACGFSAEKAAIVGTKWYCEADTSNSIVVWEFFEETVSRNRYFIDGNGMHESTKESGTYKFSSDVLTVSFDSTDETIPYTFADGQFVLDGGKFFSPQMVEEGLQGHWMLRDVSYIPIVGTSTNEYHIEFTNGAFTEEHAADAYNGAPGEYYYYGPKEGTYTLGEGCSFDTDTDELETNYFFLITDGKVTVHHYQKTMKHEGEFPGQNGYIFN